MSIIQTNNDKIHESLDAIKRLLDPKNVESTCKRINLPYNRIVFGAPGTGKSYKLQKDSEVFVNQSQIKMDVQTLIKTEVMAAKEKKNFKA